MVRVLQCLGSVVPLAMLLQCNMGSTPEKSLLIPYGQEVVSKGPQWAGPIFSHERRGLCQYFHLIASINNIQTVDHQF